MAKTSARKLLNKAILYLPPVGVFKLAKLLLGVAIAYAHQNKSRPKAAFGMLVYGHQGT